MTKKAAPALIAAALALAGDYSEVKANPASYVHERAHAHSSSASKLLVELNEMIKGWRDLETYYIQVVSKVVEGGVFNQAHYLNNKQLLTSIREVEQALALATPPGEIARIHLSLQRSVAKVRTRLATIENFYRQFDEEQEEFLSELSGKALSDFADHGTKQLAKLA